MVILVGVTNTYADRETGTVPGAPGPGLPRRGGPRMRAAILVVAGAVIAGGGFAVAEAVAGPGHGAGAGTASIPASGPAGQAALLNGVLADATSASSATGTSTRPGDAALALHRIRRALVRLRLLGGMYGQYTFETEKGPRTLAFERGTVISVAGADVTVRAKDGTTLTWVLTSTSVVRENGARAAASALAVGQSVFAAGPVSGTTRDARLIVIHAAGKHPA